MFKLHNAVSAAVNGKTVVAFNEVTGIAEALAAGQRYSKFILLKTDAGDLPFAAELTDMNTDPRSRPFVTKTVCVTEGEFTLKAAGLSYDGKSTVNIAVFEGGLKKEAADRLTVSVTLYLEWDKADATFCGGDNPLVRFLLGEGDLGEFTMGFGTNLAPLSEIRRTTGDFRATAPAEVKIDAGGITVSAVSKYETEEAVVMMDGTPVLRALTYKTDLHTLTGSGRTDSAGKLNVGLNVAQVFNPVCDGVPITDYRLYRVYNSAGKPVPLPYKVSPLSRFEGDGDCKRAAAVSGREAAVFEIKDGEVCPVRQVRVDGLQELTRLTIDGSLFDFTSKGLKRSGADGKIEIYDLRLPDDWQVACRPSGGWHAALRYGRTVKRCLLSGGKIAELESFTLSGNEAYYMGKFDGVRLVMCGIGNAAKAVTADGSNADIEFVLDDVMDAFLPVSAKMDGRMICLEDADGYSYAFNYLYYDGVDLDGARLLFNGEACADGGSLYVIDDYACSVAKLNCTPEETTADLARLKNYVLCMRGDGSLFCVPLGGNSFCLTSDSLGPSKKVTYNYTTPRSVNNGGGVRAVIRVEF